MQLTSRAKQKYEWKKINLAFKIRINKHNQLAQRAFLTISDFVFFVELYIANADIKRNA